MYVGILDKCKIKNVKLKKGIRNQEFGIRESRIGNYESEI